LKIVKRLRWLALVARRRVAYNQSNRSYALFDCKLGANDTPQRGRAGESADWICVQLIRVACEQFLIDRPVKHLTQTIIRQNHTPTTKPAPLPNPTSAVNIATIRPAPTPDTIHSATTPDPHAGSVSTGIPGTAGAVVHVTDPHCTEPHGTDDGAVDGADDGNAVDGDDDGGGGNGVAGTDNGVVDAGAVDGGALDAADYGDGMDDADHGEEIAVSLIEPVAGDNYDWEHRPRPHARAGLAIGEFPAFVHEPSDVEHPAKQREASVNRRYRHPPNKFADYRRAFRAVAFPIWVQELYRVLTEREEAGEVECFFTHRNPGELDYAKNGCLDICICPTLAAIPARHTDKHPNPTACRFHIHLFAERDDCGGC
jgi:hypothetical protein